MRKATDATYELVGRLPHRGGFKKRFPSKARETATPVTLMRTASLRAHVHVAVESKHVSSRHVRDGDCLCGDQDGAAYGDARSDRGLQSSCHRDFRGDNPLRRAG